MFGYVVWAAPMLSWHCITLPLQLPPAGSGEWATGLFCNCCNDGVETCCVASLFPFVKHGLNAESYATKIDPAASCFLGETVKWAIFGYFMLGGIVQLPLRKKVREMYGIAESDSCCGSDLMTAFCCGYCDMVQISRQLRKPLPDLSR
jgi:Cys-rich protein (TIGR01571 family)